MDGVSLLARALADGGAVTWDDPARPRLRIATQYVADLRAHAEDVRDVLSRAVTFRAQFAASVGGPGIPLLTLPGDHDGGCWSCGGPCARWRCLPCAVAVHVALDSYGAGLAALVVSAPASQSAA